MSENSVGCWRVLEASKLKNVAGTSASERESNNPYIHRFNLLFFSPGVLARLSTHMPDVFLGAMRKQRRKSRIPETAGSAGSALGR